MPIIMIIMIMMMMMIIIIIIICMYSTYMDYTLVSVFAQAKLPTAATGLTLVRRKGRVLAKKMFFHSKKSSPSIFFFHCCIWKRFREVNLFNL